MFENLTNLFASYIFTTSESTEEVEDRLQSKYKSKKRREDIQREKDRKNKTLL